MDAELHDFVRVPNWPAGRKMLEKYGNQLSATTRNIASAHENSLTLDMLVSACRKIADAQPVPASPIARVQIEKERKSPHVKVVYRLPEDGRLPPDLVSLKQKVIEWLAEQRDIRGRLRQLAYAESGDHGTAMYRLSAKIIRLETLLQDAYGRMDHYDRMGEYLPGTVPISKEKRLVELLLRQQNNKDYIRRYTESDIEKQRREAVRRQEELAELKALLDEKEGH